MKNDKLIQKALESYRRELLAEADEIIKNKNGNTARYIYNDLSEVMKKLDEVENKLNTDYPTWDDIPF